jgi:hypothetical protein
MNIGENMKKYLNLLNKEIEFFELLLKNQEIPSRVVLFIFGRIKKLKEMRDNEVKNGTSN